MYSYNQSFSVLIKKITPRVRYPWQREWGRGCQTSSPHPELENHSSPCPVTWNGDALSRGNGSGTCCEWPAPLSQSWWLRRQETCCENESVSFPIPPWTSSGYDSSPSCRLRGTWSESESETCPCLGCESATLTLTFGDPSTLSESGCGRRRGQVITEDTL